MLIEELLIATLFVFVLSDSRIIALAWLKDVKLFMLLFSGFACFKLFETVFYTKKIFKALLIPFFIALLLIIKVDDPLSSLQRVISWGVCYFVIPTLITVVYLNYKETFLIKIFIAFSILLFIGVFFYFLGFSGVLLGGRFRGVMGNPNAIAFFAVLVIVFFDITKSKVEKLSNTSFYILLSPAYISILLSQSRNAIFCLAIYFLFKKISKFSNGLAIFLAIVFAFLYDFVNSNLVVILNQLNLQSYFRLETLKSGSGRFVAWQYALSHVKDNFWFGGGLNYTDYIFALNKRKLSLMGHQGNAHNSYLTLWLDIGLVGLLFFVRAFIISFLQAAKTHYASVAVLCVVLFSAFFESWLSAVLSANIFMILIIWAMLSVEDNIIDRSFLPNVINLKA